MSAIDDFAAAAYQEIVAGKQLFVHSAPLTSQSQQAFECHAMPFHLPPDLRTILRKVLNIHWFWVAPKVRPTGMSLTRYHARKALMPAVLIGSFVAPTLWIALSMSDAPFDKFWLVPAFGLSFRIFFWPFVALGLALFGYPVLWVFRPFLRHRWMIIVAVLWGGLSGKAIAYLIFGDPIAEIDNGFDSLFLLYGVFTGASWCLLYQRAMRAEQDQVTLPR